MPVRNAQAIPPGQSATVFIVLRGALQYTQHPNGFNAVRINAGMWSEEFGARPPGDYRLEAMEDSYWVCVSPLGTRPAPFVRKAVALSGGDRFTIEIGETVVIAQGSYELGGQTFDGPRVIVAKNDRCIITSTSETLKLFSFKIR